MRPALPVMVGSLLLASVAGLPAQTLKGSRVAMERQNEVAREHDFTFLRDAAHVRKLASLGLLGPSGAARTTSSTGCPARTRGRP